MAIRASRNLALADLPTNPAAMILGSIFTTPDTFDTFVGTGTGVKQLAYAGAATSKTLSSATPAATSVVDGELTASAASISGGNALRGVRGNVTFTASTGAFIYGTQGKLTIKGTLNDATSAYQAALVGQWDLSQCTGLTAGNLSLLWLDTGDNNPSCNLAIASAISITNTGAGNSFLDSILKLDAQASHFINATGYTDHYIVDATGKTFANLGLKVKVGATEYFLPLYGP